MKKILLFVLVLCAFEAVAQEVVKDSLNVYRDTTQNAFFEYREIQYDDGSQMITTQNIGDTSEAYNYLKNIIYDQKLLLQRGIRLVYDNDNESNATKNLVDPFLVLVDSLEYYEWARNEFGGRYTGIWQIKTDVLDTYLRVDIPDGYAFTDRLRAREVIYNEITEEWDNVTLGLAGNIKIEANNMFSLNGVLTDNWDIARTGKTDFKGRPIYGAAINSVIKWIKKIE